MGKATMSRLPNAVRAQMMDFAPSQLSDIPGGVERSCCCVAILQVILLIVYLVYFSNSFTVCQRTTYVSLSNEAYCSPVKITMNDVYEIDTNGFWSTSYQWSFSKTQLSAYFVDFTTSKTSWPSKYGLALSNKYAQWNTDWSNQSMVQNLMSMVVSESKVDVNDQILLARVIADPSFIMDVSYVTAFVVNFDLQSSSSFYFPITYQDQGDVLRLSALKTDWATNVPDWQFGDNTIFSYEYDASSTNEVDLNKYSLWVAASVNSGVIQISDLTDLKLTSFSSAYALSSDCVVPSYQSDGFCDPVNNVESCSWDGGDCCESTCGVGYAESYPCGSDGYNCKNTDASDFGDESEATTSTYVDDLAYYSDTYYDDSAVLNTSYVPTSELVAYVL